MTTAPERTRHPMQDWIPDTRTLLIGGTPTQPQGETWDVINPATEDVLAPGGGAPGDPVHTAVGAPPAGAAPPPPRVPPAPPPPRQAFPAWAALSGEGRSRHIHRLADAMEKA